MILNLIYKFLVLILLSFYISSCTVLNENGFTNEVGGAIIIAEDVLTPSPPPGDCRSLPKAKISDCLKKADELTAAIKNRSQ